MTDRPGEERSQLCPAELIGGRQTVDETRAVPGPRSGDDKFAAMPTPREDKTSDSNKFHSAWIGLDAKLTAPQAAADQTVVDDPARLTVPNRSQLISSSWKHPTLV